MRRTDLEQSGPSVAPLNAVIAGHAAVEFMVAATGIRAPVRLITYRGDLGRTTTSDGKPGRNCYYCKEIRGTRADADVERYCASHILTASPKIRLPYRESFGR